MPQIVEVIKKLGPDSRLLVIDDGSTDNSTVALENLATHHPEIKFISLGRNLGKAAALRRGFNEARSLKTRRSCCMENA